MKNSKNDAMSKVTDSGSKPIPMIVNLDKPKGARAYLKSLRLPSRGQISFVETASGRKLFFDAMTDEEAVHYAKVLYYEWGLP